MWNIIILLFIFNGIRKSVQDCSDLKDCESCVLQSSWVDNCRWCPIDNECHATGAAFTNPCKTDQNIQTSSSCRPPIKYDPQLSFKIFSYAALAYSDYPENCKQAHDPENGRQVIFKFSKKCDFAGNKCFAYISVDTQQNAIILAYRGSSTAQLPIEALEGLAPKQEADIGGKVNDYFGSAFDVLWPELNATLQSVLKQMPNAKIWLTGHSLGGSLASLAGAEIAYLKLTNNDNIYLYTYGEPRTGSYYYARAHDEKISRSYRVVNANDLVPHIPPCFQVPTVACVGFTSFSYHHELEIWYPNGMTFGPDENYKTCTGMPFGEDSGCSDSLEPKFSVSAHSQYFGLTEIGSFEHVHCDSNQRQAAPAMRLLNAVKYDENRVTVTEVQSI